jgi:hypothetical protein
LTPAIDLYDQTAHQEDGSSAWWYKRVDINGSDVNLGQVSFIKVTSQGSGYTSAPDVNISGGGGTGASAFTVISEGKVTAILLSSKGSGYTNPPAIEITGGGGSGSAADAFCSDGWHKGFGRIKSDFEYTQDETPVYDEGKNQFAFKKEVLKGNILFTSIQDDVFTEQFLSKDASKYYWAIFQHAGVSRENFNKYRYVGIVKIPKNYRSAAPGREPELKGMVQCNRQAISVESLSLPVRDIAGNYSLAPYEMYSVQEEIAEPVI